MRGVHLTEVISQTQLTLAAKITDIRHQEWAFIIELTAALEAIEASAHIAIAGNLYREGGKKDTLPHLP